MPTWSDYYDLLAARAVTPERIAKLKKAGKPATRAHTITEDANLGNYLPVYSDNSLRTQEAGDFSCSQVFFKNNQLYPYLMFLPFYRSWYYLEFLFRLLSSVERN